MIRKDVIFAVLTTFSLCVLIFAVIPIRSGLPYDPWTDINEDGVINMKDIANAAGQFMATGNPTKNVTIAGHSNKLAFNVTIILDWSSGYATEWIPIDGYSKVTVCIDFNEPVPPANNHYTLMTAHYGGTAAFVVDQIDNFGYSLVKTYDVPNQQIYVEIQNEATYQATVTIDVYLIA